MRVSTVFLVWIALMATVAETLASQPAGDALRAPIPAAERTRILVLGTPHLDPLEDLDPAALDPLLELLETWKPDAIGVEVLPPAEIAAMLEHPVYETVVDRFAAERVKMGRFVQRRLGLSWHEALARADSLGPVRIGETGSETSLRRDLILLRLAGYETESAILHYARLLEESPATLESLPEPVRAHLEKRLASPDERIRIGVELARRLDLSRVTPIDDHLDKDLFLSLSGDLLAELEAHEAYRELVAFRPGEAILRDTRDALARGDVISLYRDLNDPVHLTEDVDLQWNLFFRTRLASGLDRARVAAWEVRNLVIAAHVRRMTATIPGGRALVVIGRAHKPFLDAYLGRMMDVEVVDAATVLGRRDG